MKKLSLFLIIFSFVCLSALEKEDEKEMEKLDEFSIEELMDVKISVASRKAEKVEKAPGVVTVITAEMIRQNHCRDLIDVFNVEAGFTITTDLFGFNISKRYDVVQFSLLGFVSLLLTPTFLNLTPIQL